MTAAAECKGKNSLAGPELTQSAGSDCGRSGVCGGRVGFVGHSMHSEHRGEMLDVRNKRRCPWFKAGAEKETACKTHIPLKHDS